MTSLKLKVAQPKPSLPTPPLVAGVRAAGSPRPRPVSRVAYDRTRDLTRLIPLWPEEIAAATATARHELVAKLRRALRVERQRGKAGSTGYDLARHVALLAAYRAEHDELIDISRELSSSQQVAVRSRSNHCAKTPVLLPHSTPYDSFAGPAL
jgi:hypothetical protein